MGKVKTVVQVAYTQPAIGATIRIRWLGDSSVPKYLSGMECVVVRHTRTGGVVVKEGSREVRLTWRHVDGVLDGETYYRFPFTG